MNATTTTTTPIALSLLIPSPDNVRKTASKDGIDGLAQNILELGLLNALHVKEGDNGQFEVVAGGRRLAALRLLVKTKRMAADTPIKCEIVAPENAHAISLTENELRLAMHPADQFEAFSKLRGAGDGDEAIAARYGVTPTVVRQRMKLATVSPKLMKGFREGALNLDQMMAFTLVDDHKLQESVWKQLPEWAKERGDSDRIRQILTQEDISSTNKLAKFVGLDAYREAGGEFKRDLFATDDETFLTDAALLIRLADAKLEAAKAELAGEGWKRIEAAADEPAYEETRKETRIYPGRAPLDPEQQARMQSLQTEADAIMAEHGEEPEDEKAYDRLAELGEQIDGLSDGTPVWTDEQKALAGARITISHNGDLHIVRGIVKPEDKAALKKLERAGQGDNGAEPDEAPKKKSGLPAALLAELTSHQTAAAQLELANKPDVALLAVTHVLALQAFYGFATGRHSNLEIRATETTFSMAIREDIEKSPAGKKLSSITKAWDKKLPSEPEQLWDWIGTQNRATVLGLLAVSAAQTLDLVRVNGADAKASAKQLTDALDLDMANYWKATAANYFTRIPKKLLLEQVGDDLPPARKTGLDGLKRDALAKTLETELKTKKWLPPVFTS